MTSLVTYGQRGRKLIFIHSMYNAYDEWTDGEWNWSDVTAAGYLTAAGTALIIPDPGSTLLGWGATRTTVLARNIGARVGAIAVRGAAKATTIVAPIALGYAAGAVVGTAISQVLFGDEGAQTAMGFYSGGTLPGTEAPKLSNYKYIFMPSKEGGPRSLYDIIADAPKPQFYNPTLPRRRLIDYR